MKVSIYTKTGDDGSTGLPSGERASKADPRFWALGEVDELNSHVGLSRTLAEDQNLSELSARLESIQRHLFSLNTLLANPEASGIELQLEAAAQEFERQIDSVNRNLPELRNFILPGGTLINSHLHICRCICRRAERRVVALPLSKKMPAVLKFINRLSDFLFTLAREDAVRLQKPEYLWRR